MPWLYPEVADYGGEVLGPLILSFICVSTMYIFGPLLSANGSMRQMNRVYVAGMFLNIIINALVIPEFKAIGASYATLGTQAAVAVALIITATGVFNIKWKFSFWIPMLIVTGAMVGLGFLWQEITWGPWQMRFVIYVLLGGLLSLAVKLIDIPGMLGILKQKVRT